MVRAGGVVGCKWKEAGEEWEGVGYNGYSGVLQDWRLVWRLFIFLLQLDH